MTIDNKSICVYPWKHSYIGSRYERKLCCIAEDIDEHNKTTSEEFWNSEYMKKVRLKMIAGEQIKDCQTCYTRESQGIRSLREISFDSHGLTPQDLIDTTLPDGSIQDYPNYFDYRTIHCNLQCVSCGEIYSSQHANLSLELHGKKDFEFTIDYDFEDGMAQEIIESIRNRKLSKIYWAGGEPMMSHVHWKVVEELEKVRLEDPEFLYKIFVHYNTNLTRLQWKGKLIPDLISFYQPSIQASIDGTHETFEFCRDGASWDQVSENWKIYHSRLNDRNQFGIAPILSSPVIMDIDRWFDFFEPYDPELYCHKIYSSPEFIKRSYQGFLDSKYFPSEIFDRIIDHAIKRFENSNLRNKEAAINILRAEKQEKYSNLQIYDDNESHKILKKQTLIRDKYRKTKRTYGELLNIIDKDAKEWFDSI